MCATKLASDHGHHNVIAAAFACGSFWHVVFQWLEIGMSVSSVESEHVVRFTSPVSWNNKSRDDDPFFRQFLFLRRAVSCAICSCVVFPSCECVSRCFPVLRRAQHGSGRRSRDCQHFQAIRVLLDVKRPTLSFCMDHEEIPPL